MKIFIRSKQEITAMSYERKAILDKAFRISDRIQEHILKCVIYSKNYRDYKHWIEEELATFFSDINDMTPKKGFKIKDVDYRKNLFSAFGDELEDAKREVKIFHRTFVEKHPDPYPDFNIVPELYTTYFHAWQELRDEIYHKIGKYSKETSHEEISKLLHSVLDKYCTSTSWIK